MRIANLFPRIIIISYKLLVKDARTLPKICNQTFPDLLIFGNYFGKFRVEEFKALDEVCQKNWHSLWLRDRIMSKMEPMPQLMFHLMSTDAHFANSLAILA